MPLFIVIFIIVKAVASSVLAVFVLDLDPFALFRRSELLNFALRIRLDAAFEELKVICSEHFFSVNLRIAKVVKSKLVDVVVVPVQLDEDVVDSRLERTLRLHAVILVDA
jgi:hypothetical protein